MADWIYEGGHGVILLMTFFRDPATKKVGYTDHYATELKEIEKEKE